MKINVIGVPLNLGCDREGVERAPNHLRERGLMRIIRKNGHRAFDLGNLYVPLVSEADKFARGRSLKYLRLSKSIITWQSWSTTRCAEGLSLW